MQQTFQCNRCGAQNYVGQPACWNCRASFNWQPQQPYHQQQAGVGGQQQQGSGQKTSDTTTTLKKAFGMGCLGLIIIGIVYVVLMFIVIPIAATHPAGTTPSAPALKVSVLELCSAYQKNEVGAAAKYKGKLLEVTGNIDSMGTGIGTGLFGDYYVVLQPPLQFRLYGMGGARCSFDKGNESDIAKLSAGQQVTIRGTCTGYFVDVSLSNCSLIP